MKNKKGKRILFKYIYMIIGLCVLYNIVFSISTTIAQKDYLKLFGISLFNMENNLMQQDINEGDLVIVKEVNEEYLQEGDIIAYTINGETRINKIINKKEKYTTKSNNNFYPDIEKITYNEIIGKKVFNIPHIGFLILVLQSKITSAFIILCLFFYFIYNKKVYEKKKERAIKKKMFNT